MKIFKPKTEEEIRWIAEAHEEVGELSIRNYRKTPESMKGAIQRIRNWLNDKDFKILIAYDKADNASVPLAVIICGIQKSMVNDKIVFIECLYVSPAKRRTGLAGKLIEEAHKWGKKKKAKRIKALVAYTNFNMMKLCKKLGYCESFITFEKTI